jgi:uncharacterized membrane protein YgcG
MDAGWSPEVFPQHEAWINDTANVLSGQDRERLSDGLRPYHRKTYHQLAVLTVPYLSDEGECPNRRASVWKISRHKLSEALSSQEAYLT